MMLIEHKDKKPKSGGAKTNRSNTVTVRMTPENLIAANMVATVTCRTLSTLMEYALMRYVQHNYPEAYIPGARVKIKSDDAPTDKAS